MFHSLTSPTVNPTIINSMYTTWTSWPRQLHHKSQGPSLLACALDPSIHCRSLALIFVILYSGVFFPLPSSNLLVITYIVLKETCFPDEDKYFCSSINLLEKHYVCNNLTCRRDWESGIVVCLNVPVHTFVAKTKDSEGVD